MPEFAFPYWLSGLALLPFAYWAMVVRPARNRIRQRASAALVCLAVGCLLVALSGPLERSRPRHADVVFALDVSRSIGRDAAREARAFIDRALAAKHADARIGVVVFGADASVERLLQRTGEPLGEITTDVPTDGTDIAGAIERAVGALPAGGQRRVVLLSDGHENLGESRLAAAVAHSIDVEIITIPLEQRAERDEIRVRDVSAPARVRVHEPFEVRMTVASSTRARAHLVVLRNGVVVRDAEVDLEAGANVFALVEEAGAAGLYEYEAIVNSEADEVEENNRYQTFVEVAGPPRVLHVVGQPGYERHVSEALRTQGLTVDEIPTDAIPSTLHGLADYDLVILNDVSGFDLSVAKMERLEAYVRDAGGGLIMLGGDHSYSAGGYYGTPVERLLPVTMDVKTPVRIPTLAVTLVIDRSGSMEGQAKLGVAKAAALSAVEVLNPLDQVAVLTFDAGFEWSVPPTEVGNRRDIIERLRAVEAGGGTDLYPALAEAHRTVAALEAKVKHLIVLSDGLTNKDRDFDTLVSAIAEDGISVSTVAFGADADRPMMRRIAALGQGRFYYTEDPRNIPRIFTSETLVVSRDLVVEGETRPRLGYPGEMLAGFAADAFPALGGYQRTFPKPAAQVLLDGPDDDPLLAAWRFGLGKSVAFMSDLTGRWGRRWIEWEEFPRFVAQAARWTMRPAGAERLLPSFELRGRQGEILVDALDSDDRYLNGLVLNARVVDPARGTTEVALEQIAPGRYRGYFDVTDAGRYYVHLAGAEQSGEAPIAPRTFGVAVPYSPEFVEQGVDLDALRDIAAATGGRMLDLSAASLAAITAVNPDGSGARWRVWWPFLIAALVAVILEVVVRKAPVPEALRARLARGARPEPEPQAGYAELTAGIARVRERHLQALASGEIYRQDDPAVRARLYVGGARRG